jgi:maltose O-acetyltransferase
MIAPGTKIIDNDSHRVTTDQNERWKDPDSKPIVIKDNVWICMDSLILKGVTIGENSVVAARSVVTRDIPPNSLAAGIPAKVVRKLI